MWAYKFAIFLATVANLHENQVHAHVGLTFPPARKYDLDFLDNVRTKPPCGMPKGSIKTTIKAGTKFNITWHLGYPHQGGFRLELLDPKERLLRDLTPTTTESKYVTGDTTAQNYEVEIPFDLECRDCTIRLVRQALEWSSKYLFWSCGDVDILSPGSYREDCTGHGRAIAGRCKCDRLYYGHRCQFQDECVEDEDCGRRGSCVDVDATSAPRKQCFCQLGYYGAGCSQNSKVRQTEIQEGLYTKREISPGYTLFWRLLPDVGEIEMVMRVKGTGYAAIGWRPKGAAKQCQKFPQLYDKAGAARSLGGDKDYKDDEDANAEGEAEAEGKSEPETEPEGETKDGGEERSLLDEQLIEEEASAESSESVERKARRIEKSIDVSIGYVTHSVSTGKRKRRQAEEDPEDNDADNEVDLLETTTLEEEDTTTEEPSTTTTTSTTTSTTTAHVEEESDAEAEAEAEAEPEAENDPEAESESEPEGEAEGEAEPKASGEGVTSYTPRGEFHAMDCTDMVIGMARGDSSRIWDYYTRDRSTPRRDTFWGGTNDLTAAAGWERDGETTIVFRKKLAGNGFSDHDIVNEDMHVIWAVGQEQGDYSHAPKSGLEKGTPSEPNFYRADELKYHGRKNRGVVTMNFYDEVKRSIGSNAGSTLDFCGGEWKYPRTCKSAEEDCDYFARWVFDEASDMIDFTIQTKHTDKWTGIGFSDTPQMSLTDAVIGLVESNGRFFIMDMWTTGYLQPILESSQDLSRQEGKLEDGVTTLKFSRKRNTNDNQDVAFTDDKGMYMIFPVKGGRFNAVNKKLRKHEETPIPSSERIFIKSCRTADGKSTFTTTPKPAQLMFQASMKFVELGQLYKLPVVGTREYSDLQTKISKSLREQTPLGEVSGFQDVVVTKFKSDEFGEFVADLVVVVDKDEYEDKSNEAPTVEQALETTVKQGRIGNLKVDPQSLKMRAPVPIESTSKEAEDDEEGGFLTSTKLYIVIACISALALVALVQATCTIYKMSKKSSAGSKDKLMPPSAAWKDYAASGNGHHANHGYDSFDHDIRGGVPPPPAGARGHHHPPPPPYNGSLQRPRPGGGYSRGPPGAGLAPHHGGYSLPRPTNGYSAAPPGPAPQYGSYDRRGYHGQGRPPPGHVPDFAPDHYFMPSQRKYSGEVVRVFVDYNKK